MIKLNDKEAIRRIKNGEKILFENLIEKYYDDIYRYCYYKTRSAAAAADCTQESFLHVIQAFDAYVDRDRFKYWLYRIAANACTDYFRKNRAVCTEEQLAMCGYEDKGLKQREDAEYVQAALEQLTDIQREIIILKFYQDFKIREIAEMLGISMTAAKSRLKQGLDKLKAIAEGEQ